MNKLSKRPQLIETAMIARDSAETTRRDVSGEPLPFGVAMSPRLERQGPDPPDFLSWYAQRETKAWPQSAKGSPPIK